MTTLFTSRGCPLSCAFCDSSRFGKIWENRVRYEPLHIVEHQIREAAESGVQGIMFYDDILPLAKPRTLAIMEMTKKYNMVWRGFARTDILSKYGFEFLKQLRESGLIELFIGVESADDGVKDAIHKGTTISQDEQILDWCKKLGVRVKCSFILGLPGESMESMQKTRDWIFKHRPDRVQVGRLIVFPGVPLSDHPDQYDLKYEEQPSEDWYYSGDNGIGTKSFVSTSHLTRDEIDVFWHDLMAELKREGIPS